MPEVPVFAGHLHLEAAPRPDGRTILSRQSFRAPFHISKPYWDGEVLQVRVVNPTAGILEGDRLELDIRVQAGAALVVTTPAATRAFMMRQGAALCRQAFAVSAGGWLEYAAEPLFPHRNTDYTQTTRLEAASGGELYFVEALAPGRAGSGEIWAWRRLQLVLDVFQDGDWVLKECFLGAGDDLRRLAAFHGMAEAWFATAVAVSPKLDSAEAVWDRIRALHGGGRWVGATRLRAGVWIVRLATTGSVLLRDTLAEMRAILGETLPYLKSDLRRI